MYKFNKTFDTFSGSFSSNAAGDLDVFTLQNPHPLVQVSPIIIIVAVAVPLPPPQHSPIFGHLASSHTVANLRVLFHIYNKYMNVCDYDTNE